MTIVYLIDYNPIDNSGVIQKIKQQSMQWRKQGHKVYLVSSKTMAIYDENYNIIMQEKSLNIRFGRVGTAMKLLYSSYAIYRLLKHIEFDLIYMRYRLYMPFFTKVLKENKIVMEINSDDTLEYKLHSKLTHLYNKYTRNNVLKHIDAFVSVSYELKDKFTYLNRPIEVIANGINIKEYEIKSNINQNKKPILVFIGSPNQSWHGVDKIIMLAKHFKQYQFYIIGIDGENSENVHYFGYLSKEESTKIINQCDIGIGTLSLYKTGLKEASPLKSRQYLACGLPILYAYKDTDIPDDVLFGLRLDNSEDNLNYHRIEQFVEKVFNNRSVNLKARVFAQEVLDYDKKEQSRLEFFKKVLHEK
jgi:glycosyltransferase involved in cell wall biosynthesis